MRLGTKEVKKTRLRYHGGLHSGFEFIPECIRTAIPPLANGSSQPSVFNVVNNLGALGYKPLVNVDALKPVRRR